MRRGNVYYVAWGENGKQRRKSLDTTSLAEAYRRLQAWIRKQSQDKWHDLKKNPTIERFLRDAIVNNA